MSRKSKLLMDESPLQVQPSTVKFLGNADDALFMQQLHYLLLRKLEDQKDIYDGRPWVFNTYNDWQKKFHWWSVSTIRRIIKRMEDAGYLISTDKYNRMGQDRTKWYTIDYERWEAAQEEAAATAQAEELEDHQAQDSGNEPVQNEQSTCQSDKPLVQNEQSGCSKRTGASVQNEQTVTKDSKSTSKDSKDSRRKQDYDDDSRYMKLAKRFLERIRAWHPEYKFTGNMQTWADDFRKIIELDKITEDRLGEVVEFATTDGFWRKNILSPRKLREKWNQLTAALQDNRTAPKSGGSNLDKLKAMGANLDD